VFASSLSAAFAGGVGDKAAAAESRAASEAEGRMGFFFILLRAGSRISAHPCVVRDDDILRQLHPHPPPAAPITPLDPSLLK
jgi:hypothetical protein